jgi:hypothetical protein
MSPLWRWSAVAEWLYQQGKISNYNVVDSANMVEGVNAALELIDKDSFEHKRKILNELFWKERLASRSSSDLI